MDWGVLYLAGGAAAFSFAIGVWVGGRMVGALALSEIAAQGFFNLNGVRYRVDRIGRRPKGVTE